MRKYAFKKAIDFPENYPSRMPISDERIKSYLKIWQELINVFGIDNIKKWPDQLDQVLLNNAAKNLQSIAINEGLLSENDEVDKLYGLLEHVIYNYLFPYGRTIDILKEISPDTYIGDTEIHGFN